MAVTKVVQNLNRLVEVNRKLDPLLKEKRALEAEIKATVEKTDGEYVSTEPLPNGKVLKAAKTPRSSWKSSALVKLATKLEASKHQLAACKTLSNNPAIKQVNPA